MLERLLAGVVVIGALLWGASLLATPAEPLLDEGPSSPAADGERDAPADPVLAPRLDHGKEDDDEEEDEEEEREERKEKRKGRRIRD